MNQSKSPPIPTSSSSSLGGCSCLAASFLAGLSSLTYFWVSLTGVGAEVTASSSATLNLL